MKTKFHLLLSAITCILAIGCTQEITELDYADREGSEETAFKIELSQTSVTLRESFSATISATVRPWSANTGAINWTSSNPDVASVDDKGVINALSVGEAVVTAEVRGQKAECNVTVIDWRIPAENVEFNFTSISFKIGESVTLNAAITPETTTDQMEMTSSDEDVVSIDAAGNIIAKKNGTARINVIVGDLSYSIPVLVHGDLWLEQTDALVRPVNFETFAWAPDTIRVARGETATVQAIAYASTSQGNITPSVKYFALQGQETGFAAQPKIYWLPDIKCTSHWDPWFGGAAPDRYPDEEKYIPDPMMPVDEYTVSLSAGQKHGLWVEFDIPRDLPAGLYEGCLAVQGTDSGELPFVVKVYDVTLPERQSLAIHQWVSNELQAMNNGTQPNKNTTLQLLENKVIPLLVEYGQNSFRAMYYDRPNQKYAIKNDDGSYKVLYDFSELDREIDMLLRVCPDLRYYQGKTGSMLVSVAQKGEGILGLRAYALDENGNLKVSDRGDGTYEPEIIYVDQMDQPVPEAKMYAKQYFSALKEFLESKKLPDGRTGLDIFLQSICDEPNDKAVPPYMRVAEYIREAAPGLKIMEPLGTHDIRPELIDIPCPCIDVLRGEEGYPWDDNLQSRWIYSAVGPQGNAINRFIRIPLIKTRLMHWLNYRYSAVGYLHWGPNYWESAPNGDPWQDAYGGYIGGDSWIIWPGDQTVYPSVRLAAMRDGIRDYELLSMLGEINSAEAMEICRSRATNYVTHNTDVEEFREIRKYILEKLSMN